MNAWLILLLAGLLETCWVVGLKYTDGLTRLWPSLFTAIAFTASLVLLALAVRHLPIGTAYPVWVGIGTLGAVIWGVWHFDEAVTFARMAFLTLLLVAIIGLKLSSTT
ncbi:DMT family transporter [Rubinisphaera margarita]|uniref:DMT family transporter n=1 Tax=Rubinisphaera margarita TaxID=2909586 RepID=UPI001EE85376|nr:multidrug efflux SMR transporter [Rubinisphaera margarita]MCG6154595.1 multidrug efflux SMR transporter [Rubinisphaera margarita]